MVSSCLLVVPSPCCCALHIHKASSLSAAVAYRPEVEWVYTLQLTSRHGLPRGCQLHRIIVLTGLTAGQKEGLVGLQWHPCTHLLAVVTVSGAVHLWAQVYKENWSAFAPDFTELQENEAIPLPYVVSTTLTVGVGIVFIYVFSSVRT